MPTGACIYDNHDMTKTCYMCSAPATTVEHAPARMFFPEGKDLPHGADYRKNLITVPSCPTHNTSSSKDDEYAVVIVAAHFENAAVATEHYANKISRALKHSAPFVAKAFATARRVLVNDRPSLAFKVDDARFELVMEKVARAIYFHHTGRKWMTPLRVHSTSFAQSDDASVSLGTAPEYQALKQSGSALFAAQPKHGDNPDVFYYQMSPSETLCCIRLTFYRGFEVYALDASLNGDSASDAPAV